MRREVSPVLVAASLLLLLLGVLVAYWRGLTPEPPVGRYANPDELGKYSRPEGVSDETLARQSPRQGTADFTVSTLAGSRDPGHADGPARVARFDGPAAVAVDPDGTLYVADSRNHAIRRISPNGQVSTVAGGPVPGHFGGYADGPPRAARFCAPAGVAVLPDGGVLVADTGNHRLRRIARDGTVSTIAGSATASDGLGQALGGYRDGPALQAQFRFPTGLAVDAEGVIYIADTGNSRVRRLAKGVVTTVPTSEGGMRAPTAVLVASDSSLLASDSVGRGGEEAALWTRTGSGPLSHLHLAQTPLLEPTTLSHEETYSFGLRTPAGLAYTSRPGTPPRPSGRSTAFFFVDASSHCLNWSGELGDETRPPAVVAGEAGTPGYVDGPGDTARFRIPAGLAARPGGTLYVADFGNNCIRKVELR